MHENTSTAAQPQNSSSAVAKEVAPTHHSFDFDSELALNDKFPIQLKLSVGAANDPLEHEADGMADRVMRMPNSPFVQRKPACTLDDERVHLKPLAKQITPFIQAKGDGAGTVSDSVSSRIKSTMGGGSGMEGGAKTFMESRFGTDFSTVKIHNNTESEQLNRSLNAKAFTVNNNIYFNKNQYQPETDTGRHLLAHELTHVVQQTGYNKLRKEELVQRFESEEHQELGDKATGSARYNLGNDADKFELTHGDILALSGDVFMPEDLFRLAALPGRQGQAVGTRDEVLWALQDPRIWEMRSTKGNTYSGFNDPRFTGTGPYATYNFSVDVKKSGF